MKKRLIKMAAAMGAAALMFGNTGTTALAHNSAHAVVHSGQSGSDQTWQDGQSTPAVWCNADGSCDADGVCAIGGVCDGSHGWGSGGSDNSHHDNDYHDDSESHHESESQHDRGSHHGGSKHHH